MTIMKKLIYLHAIVFMLLMACAEQKDAAYINPPFPHLNPETTQLILNAGEGDKFVYNTTGTTITIPPDIWVDATGQKIKDSITVTYREFHVAYDIFLSRANLSYNSAGTNNSFVTAGMSLKVLFANSPETWKNDYDQIMKQIRKEEERLRMQYAVYRTFDVAVTGFHNWDVFYKRDDRIAIKADFRFDK